jgi:hypothetical protein
MAILVFVPVAAACDAAACDAAGASEAAAGVEAAVLSAALAAGAVEAVVAAGALPHALNTSASIVSSPSVRSVLLIVESSTKGVCRTVPVCCGGAGGWWVSVC